MHKCVLKCRPFTQSEYIFIVGQLRVWEIMKNIKRCTSPFLSFSELNLKFWSF